MKIHKSPKSWAVLALALFALGLAACSAMPVLRGDLDEVQADQAAAADAAESGNLLRTLLFSASAVAGSVAVALRKVKRQDEAPFEATVGGRKIQFSEDEIGEAVLAHKNGIKS